MHLTPSPTCPLESPIATKALNLVLCPALVCFCTGIIFSTSSFRAGPMNIDDLVLLDGKREKVNFLQTLDLSILYKTAKLGHGDPIFLLLSSSSSASATASVSSTSSPSSITSPSSVAKSSSETSTITTAGWSSVRHSLNEVNQADISLVCSIVFVQGFIKSLLRH